MATVAPVQAESGPGSLHFGPSFNNRTQVLTRFDNSFRYQNLVAFVTGVDLNAKTVQIRKSVMPKNKQMHTVKADKAVVVIINEDGSKVGSLSDLKIGLKSHFFVKKMSSDSSPSYDALLITQFQFAKSVPPPGSPKIQFSASSGVSAEANATVNIPLVLSASSSSDVTVMYSLTGGTAVGGGNDYSLTNGTVTIPAGQTSASIPLNILEDLLDEPDETIEITLSSPTNATLHGTQVYTQTIQQSDRPSVSFETASHILVESNTTVSLPVVLSKTSSNEVRIRYAVTGTATAGGVDISFPNGQLVFPAGQTTQNLSFQLMDDSLDEPDETVIVTLYDPSNVVLGSMSVHTHLVLDND